MTREEIIADIDRQIEPHIASITNAVQIGTSRGIEQALRAATGPLNGLFAAKDIVTRVSED